MAKLVNLPVFVSTRLWRGQVCVLYVYIVECHVLAYARVSLCICAAVVPVRTCTVHTFIFYRVELTVRMISLVFA